MAKSYFAEHGVDFTEHDVSVDRAGLREMVMATGQYGVPVIVVGDKAMTGWNPSEFEDLMARHTRGETRRG